MGETRCNRCNRKLADPQATYGWRCAEILGISSSVVSTSKAKMDDFTHAAHSAMELLNIGENRDLSAEEKEALAQIISREMQGERWQFRGNGRDEIIRVMAQQSIPAPHQYKVPDPSEAVDFPPNDAFYSIGYYMARLFEKQAAGELLYPQSIMSTLFVFMRDEYSLESLQRRVYKSFSDIVAEYDAMFYLKAFTEVNQTRITQSQKRIIADAFINIEIDILARTLYAEADPRKSNFTAEMDPMLQIFATRQLRDSGGQRRLREKKDKADAQLIVTDRMPYISTQGIVIDDDTKLPDGFSYRNDFIDINGITKPLSDSTKGRLGGFLFAYRQFTGMSWCEDEPSLALHMAKNLTNRNKNDLCYQKAIEYVLGDYKDGVYHSKIKELGFDSFLPSSRFKPEKAKDGIFIKCGDTYFYTPAPPPKQQ